MANCNDYDFDMMVKKMREIWTPEDFIKATEILMYAGYHDENNDENNNNG